MKALTSLLLGLVILSGFPYGDLRGQSKPAPGIPRIEGEYVTVYRPAADVFLGPNTIELRAGQRYETWVPNDHGFIRAEDGRWHAFGITHPLTSANKVHEGEYMSFHARAPAGPLKSALQDASWEDLPKILPPHQRPGEIAENHAPTIIRKEGLYYMIYGPSPMRVATSPDLMSWTPRGELFREPEGARDPGVVYWDGLYYLYYCTGTSVKVRTSRNLFTWSESQIVLRMSAEGQSVAPESPVAVRRNGRYYLFVCAWNGIWDRKEISGAYQHVTYVYQSDNPVEFAGSKELTRLNAHAPEVFQGESGEWYISSAEWPERGISIARLVWE